MKKLISKGFGNKVYLTEIDGKKYIIKKFPLLLILKCLFNFLISVSRI